VTSTPWDAQGEAQLLVAGLIATASWPASTAVSRMSEAGAGRDALAQQLLRPEAVPGSGLDDDPIL
jgi:hypothetical protein